MLIGMLSFVARLSTSSGCPKENSETDFRPRSLNVAEAPQAHLGPLAHSLRLRKFPCAVEDFLARSIEAYGAVPTLHDWQTIRNFAVTAAELDGNCSDR